MDAGQYEERLKVRYSHDPVTSSLLQQRHWQTILHLIISVRLPNLNTTFKKNLIVSIAEFLVQFGLESIFFLLQVMYMTNRCNPTRI
jgi:hypothetical protein